jgi:hypothetical protein
VQNAGSGSAPTKRRASTTSDGPPTKKRLTVCPKESTRIGGNLAYGEEQVDLDDTEGVLMWHKGSHEKDEDILTKEWRLKQDPLSFIPDPVDMDAVEIGEAGPGPSTMAYRKRNLHRILDDNNENRVFEENNLAGKVIRVDSEVKKEWLKRFPNEVHATNEVPGDYSPFASALDWRIAHWAVSEGIKHGSIDRLLQIPGVCTPVPGSDPNS